MDEKILQEIKDTLVRMGFTHIDKDDDIRTIVSVFESAWVDYKDDGFKISLEEVITYGLELIYILISAVEQLQAERDVWKADAINTGKQLEDKERENCVLRETMNPDQTTVDNVLVEQEQEIMGLCKQLAEAQAEIVLYKSRWEDSQKLLLDVNHERQKLQARVKRLQTSLGDEYSGTVEK